MSFVFKHRHNKKDVVGKQRNFWSQVYNNALSMYQALEIAWLNASKKVARGQKKAICLWVEAAGSCFLFSLTEWISTVKIETVMIKCDSLNSMVYPDLRHMQGGGKRDKDLAREKERVCVIGEDLLKLQSNYFWSYWLKVPILYLCISAVIVYKLNHKRQCFHQDIKQ